MVPEKIIIIDGSSYFFRAFFAIQRLATSKGFPTNAIYGFINMLIKVLEVEKPKKLAIVFDTPKPSFRKELYQDYKSTRLAPPDDLVIQIPYIQRAVDCFRIKRLEAEGFEADDVIGTLAKHAERDGYTVEIITGDKDLMQLINDKVSLYDTMKDKRISAATVVERFGVRPDQMVDFLALMGDSSDNIPGVTGIGEKTAADLIRGYGSLDGLYQNLDKLKEKRRQVLTREKDNAYLSQKLATIHCEIPFRFSWEEMSYHGPDLDQLRALFEELEFQNLLKRFDLKASEKAFQKGNYQVVQRMEQLIGLCETLKSVPLLAVDTETTSLSVQDAKLVGISLSFKEGEAYYIPIAHHAPGDPSQRLAGQLEEGAIRSHLKPILENPEIKKVGQNLKYDSQIFLHWGVALHGISDDTLVESYLLDPEQPHNLDSLAFRYLGHQNITYEEVTGRGKMQVSFAEISIERAAEYSGEDADVTLRIHEKLLPELKRHELWKLYREVEMPLIEVLADMEYRGVRIDEKKLKQMSEDLARELAETERQVFKLAGESFNINSPKQLSVILFEKLKLPVIRKTKTGISTDEEVLTRLLSEHPICEWIVRYRELGKLKSTFVDGLLAQIHPATGRIHTNYNQTVTATGRLSSSNPNLQNIPVGGDRYDIRSVFVASEGAGLLAADYSQVELRLLAHMSEDPELMKAFEQGEDVHEFTGRLIFGTQTVTPEQRRIAKTINFGVMYGQSPFGLSQMLKISPKEARAFIDKYFERYHGVSQFVKRLIEDARAKGYATTLLGRRRYLPEILSKNRIRRETAERAAVNAPLQGTAADMIKVAMVSLYRGLIERQLKARMILQVHDELVFEVPHAEKQVVEKLVKDEMEGALHLKIPLVVDLGWGKNWKETG